MFQKSHKLKKYNTEERCFEHFFADLLT